MRSTLLKMTLLIAVVMAVFSLSGCKCCKNKKAEKEELKKIEDVCRAKCDSIPDPGTCKAYLPRYYFDKKEGKCKEFIWGGCFGVVPFNTLEECEKCDCAKKLDLK